MEIEDDELSYQYEVWYDEDETLHKGKIKLIVGNPSGGIHQHVNRYF